MLVNMITKYAIPLSIEDFLKDSSYASLVLLVGSVKLQFHSTKYKDSKIESPLARNAAVYPFVISGDFNDFLVMANNYLTVFLWPVNLEQQSLPGFKHSSVYPRPTIRIILAITPYWTYILEESLMFDNNEKLISAEARAPKLDMRTKKAADVPRLLWQT